MEDKIMKFFNQKLKDCKMQNVIENHNYINAANKARRWIVRNTIQGKGIVITNKQRIIYQEVTGYYIPTLLQWGMRDTAIAYAEYLCDIQESNGAWLDFSKSRCSVFNTGQVLRGLYAITDIYPRAYDNLIKGCNWLLTNMQEDGRLKATEGTPWSDIGFNSELIHLYCLPPLLYTGQKYKRQDYIDAVEKIKNYYIKNYKNDINNFNYLSHFYAYVLEALVDLGETEIVKKAMTKIQKLQKLDGAVPALSGCNWVCSTGLFQFAIVWFKLGDWKHGNKAFDYAVNLQNKSGGWYGGYPASLKIGGGKRVIYSVKEQVNYFPDEEISWAVKYFLDALYYRAKVEFEYKAHTFIKYIDSDDGKYQAVYKELNMLEMHHKRSLKIADIGCGKGRYLKKMLMDRPDNEYYGLDLSEVVLQYAKNSRLNLSLGNILCTGYNTEEFDLVFAAESVEHAIFIDLAIKELCRITKPGGSVVIIDKYERAFNDFKYEDWILPEELSTKQWLNEEKVENYFKENGLSEIEVFDIPVKEGKLYKAFIGRK